MSYYNIDKEEYSSRGVVGTILIHLLLLLCFLFLCLRAPFPPPEEEGILINFGTVEEGMGNEKPASAESVSPPKSDSNQDKLADAKNKSEASKSSQPDKVVDNELESFNDPEAPALPKKDPKKKKKDLNKDEQNKKNKQDPSAAPEQKEEEKKVDSRALFTKKEDSDSQNTSQGNSTNATGDQGSTKGTDQTADNYRNDMESVGQSRKGISHDLSGRSLVSFPNINDRSQHEGIVAIKIKVDQNGKVMFADYTSRGSTTSNSTLKNLAIKAAKEAKFNFAPDAKEVQTGTIYFTFKVE